MFLDYNHFCIALLQCYIQSMNMNMFLSDQLIAVFFHYLNLKQSISSLKTLCRNINLLFFINS